MRRMMMMVPALILSAALAAPALAQNAGDLEQAQRENERLRQQLRAQQGEQEAMRQRNHELERQREQNTGALRDLRARNDELGAGLEAFSESVLKARFDLERLQQRSEMLRRQNTELRGELEHVKHSEKHEAEDFARLQKQLGENEQRIHAAELELAEAQLRVDQAGRLEALRRGPTVSLEFTGGTMAQYIAAVRQSLGDRPANIVVNPEGMQRPVPAMKLEAVSLEAALRAAMPGAVNPDGGKWNLTPLSSPADGAAPVYRLEYTAAATSAFAGGVRPTQVQVFSIRDMIAGPGEQIRPETLLSAVETGLEMAAAGAGIDGGAELKFHPDSGLLIVKADVDTLRLVREMIAEMQGDLVRRRAENSRAQLETIQFQQQRRIAEIDLAEAHKTLEQQRQRLNEARALHEQASISRAELLEAESAFHRAEAAAARAQVVMDVVQQRDAGTPGGPRMRVYTVLPGDTLPTIAARELGDAQHTAAIERLNPGLDPRELRPGQQIRLPDAIDGPRR